MLRTEGYFFRLEEYKIKAKIFYIRKKSFQSGKCNKNATLHYYVN